MHMPEWLVHFPLGEKLHVVDGDNFIDKPWEEMESLQDFLKIPREITRKSFKKSKSKDFYCWKSKGKNMSCMPSRKGHMHEIKADLEAKLRSFFRPHNQNLFKMLDRTFDWE